MWSSMKRTESPTTNRKSSSLLILTKRNLEKYKRGIFPSSKEVEELLAFNPPFYLRKVLQEGRVREWQKY